MLSVGLDGPCTTPGQSVTIVGLVLIDVCIVEEVRFQPLLCLRALAKQTSEVAPLDKDGTEIGRDKTDASAQVMGRTRSMTV